jgi:polyhydroxyalkanoate synthase
MEKNLSNQGFVMPPNWSIPRLSPTDMTLIPPEQLAAIEKKYLADMLMVWSGKKPELEVDNRFKSNIWNEGWSEIVYQTYLVNSQHLKSLANAVEAEPKVKNKIIFATEQLISTLAPSNFLATNPEAINELIATRGQSLTNGLMHLLADMQQGKISQTTTDTFEVGVNLATTEGSVVFQNELFQLIQYKPLTASVFEKPILMVPPCINKFYILDLKPESSMVRFLVEEGFTVFMISWKNADESMSQVTWDDYVASGVIKAMQVCIEISKVPQINVLGFCVGGTILASALAVLANQGIHPAASLILLTSFLDFTDTGVLDVFIDETMVDMREKTIGGKTGNFGLLSGVELGNTFSFLRPNELVWNYVVSNYLLGKTPPTFDLLYWNSDSTNLPGPMFSWYLRHMYLNNELKDAGKLLICNQPVDLSKINCPSYIYASKEDHIVPWKSAFISTQILKGKNRFVLGASGHIAGVINPLKKNKRNYWVNQIKTKNPDTWINGAKSIEGSWWGDFRDWLTTQSGKQIKATTKLGNSNFKVIEPAPGSFVKEKASKI